MTPLAWIAMGLAIWLAIAVPVAVVIGKSIERRDTPAPTDPLADQPADVLSDDEITARFLRLVAPVEAEIDGRKAS